MADCKLAYGSSVAMTITLASLADDTNDTCLTGRESDAVVNTTNLYLDYLVGGKVTTSSPPGSAVHHIEIWAYAQAEDTPVYHDVFDGVDSAETITLTNKYHFLKPVASIGPTDSFNVTYWFGPISLSGLFGFIPKRWGIFVSNASGAALHSTSSNHAIWYTPVYATIT